MQSKPLILYLLISRKGRAFFDKGHKKLNLRQTNNGGNASLVIKARLRMSSWDRFMTRCIIDATEHKKSTRWENMQKCFFLFCYYLLIQLVCVKFTLLPILYRKQDLLLKSKNLEAVAFQKCPVLLSIVQKLQKILNDLMLEF